MVRTGRSDECASPRNFLSRLCRILVALSALNSGQGGARKKKRSSISLDLGFNLTRFFRNPAYGDKCESNTAAKLLRGALDDLKVRLRS